MKEISAARVYARALFVAAQSTKGLTPEKVQNELLRVHQLIQSNQLLRAVLFHALIPIEKKKMLLRKTTGDAVGPLSPMVVNFLDLLLKKKRLDLLSLILHHFDQTMDESNGILKAALKSAAPLEALLKKEIENKLCSIFNKKIILEASVHPDLISGIVVKAGDVVIDGSLQTQLKNLQSLLRNAQA